MKSTVETLSPTRVRLSVEVPYEEVTPHLTEAYEKIGAQVRIPGFRPGKAPKAVIDQRVGRKAVQAQALDAVLPQQLSAAITENKVTTLGRPEITEMDDLTDGKPFNFTAEVDVAPPFELPELSDLSVTVDAAEVTDEQVDAEIEQLRLRFSSLKSVDRAAQVGDFVSIDLKATIDGEEVEGGSTTGMSHEVGSGNLVDGLEDVLVGMNADDERSFTTKLAGGDHEGDDADVLVKVNSVKERELPDLDDEFAQMASEHDTMDELRDDQRKTLAERAGVAVAQQAREKVGEELLNRVELPLPEAVLTTETEHRRTHLVEQLESMNMDLDSYLSAQGQSTEEFEAELAEEVQSSLRRQLILNKLAEQLGIEVTSEQLTAEVVRQAQQQRVPEEQFPQFVQMLRERGALVSISADLRRANALEEAVKAATVTDSNGTVLDEDALNPGRGEQPAAAEDEAGEDEAAEDTDAKE